MKIRAAYLVVALSLSCAAFPQAFWPMERQDRYGTGRAPSGPAELFSPWIDYVIDEGNLCYHGPAFGENGVGYYGSWSGHNLVKFDVESGALLGSFQAVNPVHCVPAIGADGAINIHAPKDTGIPFGRGIRVDQNDMEFDWLTSTFSTVGDRHDWSSPIYGPEGDVLVAGINTWYRLDRDTGAIVRNYGGFKAWRTPAFTRDNSKILVNLNGTGVIAYRWSDGNQVWGVSPGPVVGAPGVAETGEVIVGGFDGVVCVNPNSGAEIWFRPTVATVLAAPAFSAEGVVYVASLDWRIYAFRVSDGARLWTFTATGPITTPPVVAHNGRIYFQDRNGWVYGLSPQGQPLWSLRIGTDAVGPMTIGPDGSLYVGGQGITVIRFSEQNLRPFTFTLSPDASGDGDIGALYASDNSYLFITSTIFQPTTLTVEGQAPVGAASQIVFTSETGTKAFDPVGLKTEFYNFATNSYEVVDQRTLTRPDGTFSVSRPVGNFIEGGTRRVRARLTFTATIAQGTNRIMYRVDQTRWTLQ